jgi:peptide chain release factor 2
MSELGGYKEVVVRIEGDQVYGALKFESGGHRVQRVPATETQGRIHTSACTVAVLAEPDEAEAIKINPSDLRIDTYRASGAGGQHINKTDSAVRLTHIPTGIVVQCQDGRSQHGNRDVAWKRLRSRLYDFEMRKRQEEQQKLEDSKTDVGWGHQIRSYVLDNSRIKDLRTNYETSATQKVLDGDLDPFIQASLKQGV